MTRRVVAAMGIWTVAVATWWLFIAGGHVQMCLGPLDVTPESCRAAMGLPPLTDLDRLLESPLPAIALIAVGWAVIWAVARSRRRQRGGL